MKGEVAYNNIYQTMAKVKLFQHQEKAVELFPEKRYLAWEVGTGKTIGALAIAKHHGFEKLLIVAPKSAHQSWLNDNKHFNIDIEIATYERFRDKITDFSSFDMVVFDEAHRLSYTKTQWTKKAIQLRIDRKIKEVLLLSGTPIDRYHKIYAQIKVLNPDDEMFQKYRSYSQFVNAYFMLDDYFKPIALLRPEFKEELKAWFERYAYIVKREDVIELPKLQEIVVELKSVKLEYDISYYELANFIKEYKASSLTKEKIEYVLDFIEENPNTIVFSLFLDFVQVLQSKLRDKAYFITGSTPEEYRRRVIERQDKPIVSTYTMSEGANLQKGYKNIVFASLPLKYIEMEQAIGRVYRTGQTQKVAVYYLLQNGIDKTVLRIVKDKRNVVEYLRLVLS
ncbi:MAG: DEAD/DEAH box helicase [Fervidobacterium sp.]|nr:DEAD/DEAH box helicase [Fervidobacterium sp.]